MGNLKPNPEPQKRESIRIDHETGLIHGMPKTEEFPDGTYPLNGPTTGGEYQELKRKEKENAQAKHLLKRQILSTYQCLQCRKKWSGKHVRVKWRVQDGVNMETLVCPNQHCDGPVVMVEDALNLRQMPGGRI